MQHSFEILFYFIYLFIYLFIHLFFAFSWRACLWRPGKWKKSFLFSLKNPSGYPPEKILPFPDPHSEDACVKGAVKSRADFGPTFGEYGNIIDLSTLTGKTNRVGFAKIRQGFRTKYTEEQDYFNGYELYVVDELEVFGLTK